MKRKSRLSAKQKGLTLLGLSLAVGMILGLYRIAMNFAWFEILFWGYLVLATVLILVFVIYNRGFSRKNITPDMLPEEWSEEEKSEFLADGERRLSRSRWMLIPIFAFLITFAVDLLELVVIPFFSGAFGGGK